MKLLNSCYNYLIIFYLLTHAQLPYDVSFIVYPPSCWFICFLFVVFFWEYFIFYLFHFLFHVLVLLVLSCHFLVLLGSFVFLSHTLVLWLILVSVFNLFGVELLSLYAVIICIFVQFFSCFIFCFSQPVSFSIPYLIISCIVVCVSSISLVFNC